VGDLFKNPLAFGFHHLADLFFGYSFRGMDNDAAMSFDDDDRLVSRDPS
jgi:hypothetical protein